MLVSSSWTTSPEMSHAFDDLGPLVEVRPRASDWQEESRKVHPAFPFHRDRRFLRPWTEGAGIGNGWVRGLHRRDSCRA